MNYTITYYNEAVEEDVLRLPAGLLAHYFNLTDRMVVYGANLGEPSTAEIRLKEINDANP